MAAEQLVRHRWPENLRGLVRLLHEQTAFVTHSAWRGETVGRLAFLHPDTPVTLIDAVLEPLLV